MGMNQLVMSFKQYMQGMSKNVEPTVYNYISIYYSVHKTPNQTSKINGPYFFTVFPPSDL